jgi:two-component system response regulator RegA
MSDGHSVLLVDDDTVLRERLARGLREHGFDVRTAADVHEALEAARTDPPELVVADLRMPGPSGLTLIELLLAIEPATRIVMLTGWGSVPTAVEALQKGAAHYLQKPVTLKELIAVLVPDEAPSPQVTTMKTTTTATKTTGPGATAAAEVPSLARQEWEYIHRVLAECDDNISEAARRLGLHRRSLQRKLQKLPPTR